MKLPKLQIQRSRVRRAPRGARGLKYTVDLALNIGKVSRPARGAWIEIFEFAPYSAAARSRPARGAWIEIVMSCYHPLKALVAPREGRVD